MDTNIDFSAICRTCLSKENLLPIATDICNKSDENLINIVFIVAGIKIQINDGLPQNICKICMNNVTNTITFRQKCKEIEKELLVIREKLKTEANKLPKPLDCSEKNKLIESTEQIIIKREIELEEEQQKSVSNPQTAVTTTIESNPERKANEDTLYELDSTDATHKRVTCKLCQRKLSIRSIRSHLTTRHPGADTARVKCELCDDYVLTEKLNRHRILMHGECFRCRYCKMECKGREQLLQHVVTCPVKRKRKSYESTREMSECDVCHKSMQRASLKVHMDIKHSGLRPVCEHCGKSFGNKLRLDEHYRAKHGYEKFKCSTCDFQSASNLALRNHERRHSGERPFVCESCGAGFHAAYLLTQHRHSHRTDRNYKCDVCPARFKSNNNLHTHRRACHTRGRVSCGLCPRVYSCRHYAVKHMRSVHGCERPAPARVPTD